MGWRCNAHQGCILPCATATMCRDIKSPSDSTLRSLTLPMNASSFAPTPQPDTFLLLGTGQAQRTVCFYPSLFQLVIQRGEAQERVELGYAGSRLLDRLLQTPGEVIAREELMRHAWPDR